MEELLKPIYEERANASDTLGILFIEKRSIRDPITDTFDKILLVITNDEHTQISTTHLTDGVHKVAMHLINEAQLKRWILLGTRRKVVDWIYYGKICFDRNQYVKKMKHHLMQHPLYHRNIKMGIELAKLIRRFTEGKMFYDQQEYLDAYQCVINSLHHLAKITVINAGISPEVTVWSQVKVIDPAIYKLYEELVESDEPIQKRLELLFLASDFFIHHRSLEGARHILGVMSSKDFWSIQELHEHNELEIYSTNLEVLIEFFVEKGFIQVVEVPSPNEKVFYRFYQACQLDE